MASRHGARWLLMFCAVAVFGGLAHHADAQASEDDRTAISLAGARKKYEQSMEGTRKSILNALNAALTKAPGAKDSTDAVNKARAELQAFEREGKVPATLARWEQDYAKAAKEMKDAYARAMADYAKQKAHELADAVNAEASRFAASWDLVPWRDDLFKGKSEAERTIAPDGKELSADIGISGAYRLEVVAHRAAESNGTPTIELPLVDGRRVRVSALPDGRNVRVLLTVGGEIVSADLGVARPIDPSKAKKSGAENDGSAGGSDAAMAIVLSAEGGPIVVDSVRVKPVIVGTPPEVEERARKARPNTHPQEDYMPMSSKWAGTFTNSRGDHAIGGEVIERTATSAVVRLTNGDYGTRDWVLTINDNNAVLNTTRSVNTKTNAPGTQLKNINVSGSVDSGRLSIAGTWTWQGTRGGGTENISLSISRK